MCTSDESEGRRHRADDSLRALRASLSRREPVYHGTHYDYEGFVVDPWALQPRVPIWIGGKTARSLRRAVELADGWVPFALTDEQIQNMLAKARETEAWQQRARVVGVRVQPVLPDLGGQHQRHPVMYLGERADRLGGEHRTGHQRWRGGIGVGAPPGTPPPSALQPWTLR